ncbi:Putative diacylglycerol O-acyltransferase [Paraconexibacter sp. AEG42_29]|uniref:Diacylglycerol O-acyltransferase n=1 Tax=Paraconexibacter sp. AEG42_29 TaxID=2997339 RepID=A0AAU7ARJ9_9ACTN
MPTTSHGQRLTPVDSAFLKVETNRAHMHIGWSATFTVAPGAARPTVAGLRDRAAARLHWLPRCRQRLSASPLGPLGEPRWVDDERFDLDAHIVELTGAETVVSDESFARLRDAVLSEPLDRTRPLWQVVLVPRLGDGRVAVVGRVHHAMADGTAALLLAGLLLDADAEDGAPVPWTPAAAPGRLNAAAGALGDGAGVARSLVREGIGAVRRPRSRAQAGLRTARQLVDTVREDLLSPASPSGSIVNAANGPRRTLVGHRIPLADVRAARAAHGGTINDVALAIASGALRALTIESGHEPVPLKAMIPVSVRRPEEYGELGNRISQVTVWLPLHLDSAGARLADVRRQTERFKQTGRADGQQTLLRGVGLLRGPARDAALRVAASAHAFNLTVSNVRGPRDPLRLFGAQLDELCPVVPIGHAHGLAVGMVSHDQDLHLGLHADPDALPRAVDLPRLLSAEVDALLDRRPAPRVNGRFTRVATDAPLVPVPVG